MQTPAVDTSTTLETVNLTETSPVPPEGENLTPATTAGVSDQETTIEEAPVNLDELRETLKNKETALTEAHETLDNAKADYDKALNNAKNFEPHPSHTRYGGYFTVKDGKVVLAEAKKSHEKEFEIGGENGKTVVKCPRSWFLVQTAVDKIYEKIDENIANVNAAQGTEVANAEATIDGLDKDIESLKEKIANAEKAQPGFIWSCLCMPWTLLKNCCSFLKDLILCKCLYSTESGESEEVEEVPQEQ